MLRLSHLICARQLREQLFQAVIEARSHPHGVPAAPTAAAPAAPAAPQPQTDAGQFRPAVINAQVRARAQQQHS